MSIANRNAGAETQGHVIVYGRNARWRQSVARSLRAAGHSHSATSDPDDLRRHLLSQRYDLLALNVRDEVDAAQLAKALRDAPLPPHSILTGSASGLALIQQYGQRGTLRYSPGTLPADELRRLVDASLNSGMGPEASPDNGASSSIEEVDLEEMIDNAAAQVYARAKRKRQRFTTVVEGPGTEALADPEKLQRTLVAVLDLVVGHAPRGALISVRAQASADDWTIRIGAAANGAAGGLARLTEALRLETRVLRSAYRDISRQGGLLWVEVSRKAALGVCLALPLAPGVERGRSP
jgi:hypothetical protein